MFTTLRQKIKENSELFAICIYIAMSIFVVQVVSYAFQKYVIEGTDLLSQIIMAIFTIILWAIIIFVLVKISSPFRKFLLRMFGVDTNKSETSQEKNNVKSETEGEKVDNMTKIRLSVYVLTVVFIGVVAWIVIGEWTTLGLTIGIKNPDTTIPTLINGITASTSIVVAVFIAILGIMYRTLDKKDVKSKEFYIRAMLALIIPIFWLYTTYTLLTIGVPTFAVRYALSGLISALYACTVITIFTVTKMATDNSGSDGNEPDKSEPPSNSRETRTMNITKT